MPDMKTITIITTKKQFKGKNNILGCNCSDLIDFYYLKEIDYEKFKNKEGQFWVKEISRNDEIEIDFDLDIRIQEHEPKAIEELSNLCKEKNIPIPEYLCKYTPKGGTVPEPFWVSGDGLFYIFHDVKHIDVDDKLKSHVNALVEFVKSEHENEDIKVFLLLHRSDYLENKDDKALSYSYFMPGEKLDNELLTVRLFSHVDSPITQFIQSKIEGSIETIEDLCNRIKPERILYRAINSYAEFRPYPDGSSSELLALNKILESQELRDRAIKLIIEKNFSNSTPNNLQNILTELLKS